MQPSVPLSKLELHFSCDALKNMDRLSKSDPQVYVYLQDPRTKVWSEVGKTEVIKDNLNPKVSSQKSREEELVGFFCENSPTRTNRLI
jgi:hypothetical protein